MSQWRPSRRDLLRAGLIAGIGGTLLDVRTARAVLFGEAPPEKQSAMLAPEQVVDSVLEVFLFGGLSPYESLYCVEEFGQSDGTHFHAFPEATIEQALSECAVTGSPDLLEAFAPDSEGRSVKLGPFALPLRGRPDLLERLRVCVTSHDLEPHEAAVPMALTGRPVGHAGMAGVGASVERFFRQKEPTRTTPHSYVLRTQSPVLLDLTRPAVATGFHPASARPVAITMDANTNLAVLLERKTLGSDREHFDALVSANVERYRSRLDWKQTELRSIPYADVKASSEGVRNAQALQSVLEAKFFEPIPTNACGKELARDSTRASFQLAAHLLRHPESPARYVCVVDGGFFDSLEKVPDAGGYDTHADHCTVQSRNLFNLFTQLAAIINAPGENDPAKLDLDRTLIVLNTEFGRTPHAEGTGRGHWPYAYPVAYLGGPIRSNTRGVYGAMGVDGKPTQFIRPQEHRVALLLALGIWPFAPEAYNVSDVPDTLSEVAASRSVAERILGVV